MSQKYLLLAVLAFAGSGAGCSSLNNTEQGAIGGGLFGTAAGTVASLATGGNPLVGAAIGAGVGTAGGALIGNSADKEEKRDREISQAAALAAAQQQQQRIGMFDVIRLAQAGHDDQVIINQIRSTGSTFQITASDLDELKRAGVSSRVIAEMQVARAAPSPGRVIVRDAGPTVVYESRPAPVFIVPHHPRPYYSTGIYFSSRGRHGCHW